jgi:hypothetical protein
MSWSFGGDDFAVAASDPVFPEWFLKRVERTVDQVLGADARYVDIGGYSYEDLDLVAQFTTSAARSAIEARLGTVDTLEDDDGRSCQALLDTFEPIRVKTPDSGVLRATVRFVFVSSS